MAFSTNRYKLIAQSNPKSIAIECYRSLRTNIHYASSDRAIKTIMITSTFPNEGKSTTISNLAISYAQAGTRVLLIDADLRNPSLHRFFHVSNRMGLGQMLLHHCKPEDGMHEVHIPNLTFMPSGQLVPNPAELFASSRFDQLLASLSPSFDLILIDSAPVLAVSDSKIIASKCDGILFVVKHGKVAREAAKKALASLDQAKAHVIGVIMNDKKRTKSDYIYEY